MASETPVRPRQRASTTPWPPHDSEESIVGTDLHQTTITNVRWAMNEAARRVAASQGAQGTIPATLPWQALSQIILLGCMRADCSLYRTLPDVFVYPRRVDPRTSSLTVQVDGPPRLIVEVLSEATYEADLEQGKGFSYARAGVREYLAIDPTSAYLPEGIRAWRLIDGVYRPWDAADDGRWHSAEIGVSIGLEGVLATVYTLEGRRLLREGEVEEALDQRDATIAQLAAEIVALRRQLEEQQQGDA